MWKKYFNLSPDQNKTLRIDVVISIIINSAFNMVFSWKIAHELKQIELFGSPGIAIDFAATTFMIVLMTSFFGGHQMLRMIRSGKVSPISASHIKLSGIIRLFELLPKSPILRGLLLAMILTIIWTPIITLLLMVANINTLTPQAFYGLKFVYGVALAFFISPWIAVSFMYKKSS